MAYMTDNEFQNLMDEVLRIVQESASKDEAVEKLQGLIENKNSIFWGNQCREKISNWLYDEYKNAYDKIGKAPDSRRNEIIVSAVYEKIEECGIWIPYYEVEKYYCSKKNKYRKRYENANLSATDW